MPAPQVLDLGCGMGLAGTVAAALGAHVLFADLEPPALLFAALNSLPWRDRIRTRRTNWRTDDLGQQFPLILGADILYEKQQWISSIRSGSATSLRAAACSSASPGDRRAMRFWTGSWAAAGSSSGSNKRCPGATGPFACSCWPNKKLAGHWPASFKVRIRSACAV